MTSRRNFMIAVSAFAAASIIPTLPSLANCSSVDIPDGWGSGESVTEVGGVGITGPDTQQAGMQVMIIFAILVYGFMFYIYPKIFNKGVGGAGEDWLKIDDGSHWNYEPKPK